MNFDLVLCGVGGQGVLSIAWIVDQAAVAAGFHIKQPEVHGMAQRGGAVSALVRLADSPVASDLIAAGNASLIVSVEPMEALRYADLLRPDGWIVTDVTPMVNVANYPRPDVLYDVLFALPNLIAIDATRLAHRAGTVKAQNMVVLGAAASRLPVPAALLERFIEAQFAAKGPRIVEANIAAFRIGDAASRFAGALLARGVAAGIVARVVTRLDFAPAAVAESVVDQWAARLGARDGERLARELFAAAQTREPEAWASALPA
jgi:indolepyruvate ferredoxin oxidoreductase beta subunit